MSLKKQLITAVFLVVASPATAFEITGVKWTGARTDFYVGLEGAPISPVWRAALAAAANDWNEATDFQFTIHDGYRNPCVEDDFNGSDFSDDVCGTEYGENVLAVAIRQYETVALGPGRFTAGDVVFNNAVLWDVFDGDLDQPGRFDVVDFRRVALHELGHVAGLDHEETLDAIMAPRISNLDRLTQDDIDGVNTLYRGLSNCAIRSLRFGAANDALQQGDCTVVDLEVGGTDTSFIDVYAFSLSTPATVEFVMSGPSLDSVLLLADRDLRYLAFDEASLDVCDSTLTQDLDPGDYLVLANTFDEPIKDECGNIGAYTLNAHYTANRMLRLGATTSLRGATSNAAFRGGVSNNNGRSWGNRFRSTDSLDVRAEIEIPRPHLNLAGFIVVAAIFEGRTLLLDEQGRFVDYFGGSGPLPPAIRKVLSFRERVEVLSNLVPAALGVNNGNVDFYVGYGLDRDPGELFFHRTPINLTITP